MDWQALSHDNAAVNLMEVPADFKADRNPDFREGFTIPRKANLRVKTQRDSLQSMFGNSRSEKRNINWKEVNVRRYERIVGDNPSCSSGPPLAIGWNFDNQAHHMSIDTFEKLRTQRRNQLELILTREEREELLVDDWKIPLSDIAHAVRTTLKIKNQRRTTVTNLGKLTRLEEVMESAGRKCIRAFTLQRKPSTMAAMMIKQHFEAQAQRAKVLESVDVRLFERNSTKTPTNDIIAIRESNITHREFQFKVSPSGRSAIDNWQTIGKIANEMSTTEESHTRENRRMQNYNAMEPNYDQDVDTIEYGDDQQAEKKTKKEKKSKKEKKKKKRSTSLEKQSQI